MVISDTIPAGATYVSVGTKSGNTVTWFVGALASQASIQRSFVVTATQTITNNAYQVVADGNFSAGGQAAVVTAVSPPGQPNLVISKSGPGSVTPGSPVTYILTVTNSGDTAVSGMTITDTLPAGATYISGGTPTGNAVTWQIATSLGPQASLQRSFVVSTTQTITNDDYRVRAAPNVLGVGLKAVTTQVVPWEIYLPVTLRSSEENLKTTLLVESVNTNGSSKKPRSTLNPTGSETPTAPDTFTSPGVGATKN